MSLETTIAGLIDACRGLTDMVSQKMAGIDQKVDEATASVPSVIRGLASVSYWIDANIGDDNNPGTETQPLKSIAALAGKISNGSFVRIYLRTGQTHSVVGAGPSMSTGLFDLRAWGDGDWPIVKWSPESALTPGSAFSLKYGALVADQVAFHAQYKGAEALRSTSGFLGYQPGLVSIFLYRSVIKLENAPFCTTSIAYCQRDLSLRSVDVEIVENLNSRAKLSYNAGPEPGVLKIEANGLSLPVGLTLRDLIDFSTDENALITNLAISRF